MSQYQIHELANIFPRMPGEEFAALKADIKNNGLLEPIWLYDGKVLDGRHRYYACQEMSVTPSFREYVGSDPVGFVVSLNLMRRQLNAGQRAMAALSIESYEAGKAKLRQGARTDIVTLIPQCESGKARDKAAEKVGASPSYIQQAKKIHAEAPELAEAVKDGTKTLTQAVREVKEQKREERREENRAKVASVSSPEQASVSGAKFATIVIDPPWDWADEGDQDQLGRAKPDYATMSIEKLMELPVADLADDDCHVYLWITNRSLPKGFALLEKWGFRYITALTWVKPSFGMGNYFRGQTEHVLFGVKGSQMLKRKDVGTVFNAQRGVGGHSSKPPEFLQLVESCSPSPYLEMFSRCDREGWTTWGEGK